MEKELYYRSLRFKFYKINPYLDSHLSRYIVVKIFVTPGDFFSSSQFENWPIKISTCNFQ